MEFHYKNRGFDLKKNFEIEPSLGMGVIVLDAVADNDLWFWHAVFGFVGSCNDINILDVSPLHICFLDGSHTKTDFDYSFGEFKFNMLFSFVEGIYSQLTQFVKTLPIPLTKKSSNSLDGKKQPGRTSRAHLEFSRADGICWQVQLRSGMKSKSNTW